MKTVIHLLLFLISLGLLYALYSTIKEPIQFQTQYNKRSKAVVEKLKDIRTAQKLYRTITDTFATNFSDLEKVLTTGKFEIIQVKGDRDALDAQVTYDTIYIPAKDSIAAIGLDVMHLKEVPYSNGKEFEIFAGKIDQQGITIPVLEVSTKWGDFMGQEYGQKKYAKYNRKYSPTNRLKFGSRSKANLSGNWE